jgi:hypothetical protein
MHIHISLPELPGSQGTWGYEFFFVHLPLEVQGLKGPKTDVKRGHGIMIGVFL